MPSDALVIAPAILAVVLALSAVGKLRAPRASAEAFRDLKVPSPLNALVVVRALPWIELLLALMLVVAGGWLGIVVAVAAVVLFGAYLVLVLRALGFDVPVDCACFGEFAPGRITRRTVVRNSWFAMLAVLAVVSSFDGSALLADLVAGSLPWWWLVAAAMAATTTWLMVSELSPSRTAATSYEEIEDYVRAPTPAVTVVLGDGTTTHLRHLSAHRPQLLVYVSEWCVSCLEVISAVPQWRQQLPQVDVRIVVRQAPGSTALTSTEEPLSLHDADGSLYETFGLEGTPSAVLLGADGLLAGGPVIGSTAVPEMVADIRAQLDTASSAELDV